MEDITIRTDAEVTAEQARRVLLAIDLSDRHEALRLLSAGFGYELAEPKVDLALAAAELGIDLSEGQA